MNKKYYSRLSGQFLYSLYDSIKRKNTGQYKNHHHPETELGLILSGEATYMLAGTRYTASAGDLFIIRSNEEHCMPELESDTAMFNIQFSAYFLWNICSEYIPPEKIQSLINADIPITHKLHDSKINDCIKSIASLTVSDEDGVDYKIRREVLRAVMFVADKIPVDQSIELPRVSRLDDIQAVVDYIKLNYSEQIKLCDMASIAAMSQTYFSNTFKSICGTPPYNYLMTVRIEHALDLLKNTDKTVMAIALECGFCSITSFNKAFKKLVGIVPTEIRK